MRTTGVTRCLPTFITSSFEGIRACARVIGRRGMPAVAGIHMEGPYISPDGRRPRRAPARAVAPARSTTSNAARTSAAGPIRLVTLAPEVPGAIALIEHLVDAGRASGHRTHGSHPTQIAAAIASGRRRWPPTSATAVRRCCRAIRTPIWELLAADEVFISLIVDGHHLPRSTVKAMVRANGSDDHSRHRRDRGGGVRSGPFHDRR